MRTKILALSIGLFLGACTSSSTKPAPATEKIEIPDQLKLEARACFPNGMSCSSGTQCCSMHCVKLNNRFQCSGGGD